MSTDYRKYVEHAKVLGVLGVTDFYLSDGDIKPWADAVSAIGSGGYVGSGTNSVSFEARVGGLSFRWSEYFWDSTDGKRVVKTGFLEKVRICPAPVREEVLTIVRQTLATWDARIAELQADIATYEAPRRQLAAMADALSKGATHES